MTEVSGPARSSPAKNSSSLPQPAKLSLWPLVIATFFMVSGGTYGTEEIVHGAGYSRAILILILTPLLWSLPTAYMVGELSSAIPAEGGYYAWVRRGMGNFWGFQEAWLSLVASIFDMAIYPALFIAYLTHLFPWFARNGRGTVVGIVVVVACAVLNIAGVRVVAATSLWLFAALSAPFVLVCVLAPLRHGGLSGAAHPSGSTVGLLGGILIAMWNYMGWDSASTIAAEVDRPQRIYPRAILLAVLLVSLTYIIPVAAVAVTGLPPGAWETGSWADIAGMVGGNWLRVALVCGGLFSAFGMLNALVMSYSRLPLAMAQDGMLPPVFARVHPRTGAPWVAILVCAIGWGACVGLDLERLVTIDILLTGSSVLLEFAALVALRYREPELPRPFRVPGGITGAWLAGACPMLLLTLAAVHGQHETIFGVSALAVGVLLIVAGVVIYWLSALVRPDGWMVPARQPTSEMD
ncbi:MAG TPA: APC family permease [Candidatus Acidoferrales bacterium]|nr:APC family permease [Candidatus Acidoferrales bacterium]